ncbi:YIP1 family protein [Glaciecola sp. MH2013]|uniref:Yip1 family protein n=1 Tax=Glaciecola sp. MH2013 TaxID=2785524 RepID=UPI00189EAA10|nr:Yip1 family protein [Glaciecola sp. MH2013]MBF7072496.1 YIP1 family protein [Glaciecola sp. MH2013]
MTEENKQNNDEQAAEPTSASIDETENTQAVDLPAQKEVASVPRELTVTNPVQACNDIFIKPSEVFRSLAVKDNWSWFPFLLVSIIAVLPAYLYFGVIDFDWHVDTQLAARMGDVAPAQLESQRELMGTAESSRFFSLVFTPIALIVVSALAALYFTIVTRNDEKSVHSFFDWYGVQWWTMMPYIIGAVVSLAILVMQDPGAKLSPAVMAPLSLSYVLGLGIDSKWLTFMNEIRVERIWSVFLGAYCLQQWTHFSKAKSYIVAAIPSLFLLLLTLLFAVFS